MIGNWYGFGQSHLILTTQAWKQTLAPSDSYRHGGPQVTTFTQTSSHHNHTTTLVWCRCGVAYTTPQPHHTTLTLNGCGVGVVSVWCGVVVVVVSVWCGVVVVVVSVWCGVVSVWCKRHHTDTTLTLWCGCGASWFG